MATPKYPCAAKEVHRVCYTKLSGATAGATCCVWRWTGEISLEFQAMYMYTPSKFIEDGVRRDFGPIDWIHIFPKNSLYASFKISKIFLFDTTVAYPGLSQSFSHDQLYVSMYVTYISVSIPTPRAVADPFQLVSVIMTWNHLHSKYPYKHEKIRRKIFVPLCLFTRSTVCLNQVISDNTGKSILIRVQLDQKSTLGALRKNEGNGAKKKKNLLVLSYKIPSANSRLLTFVWNLCGILCNLHGGLICITSRHSFILSVWTWTKIRLDKKSYLQIPHPAC